MQTPAFRVNELSHFTATCAVIQDEQTCFYESCGFFLRSSFVRMTLPHDPAREGIRAVTLVETNDDSQSDIRHASGKGSAPAQILPLTRDLTRRDQAAAAI